MALETAESPATIQSQQLWRVPEYGTRISRAYPAHILARSVDSLAAFPAYPARSGDGLAAFPAFPARSADRLLCICRLVVWPLLARRGDRKPSQPDLFVIVSKHLLDHENINSIFLPRILDVYVLYAGFPGFPRICRSVGWPLLARRIGFPAFAAWSVGLCWLGGAIQNPVSQFFLLLFPNTFWITKTYIVFVFSQALELQPAKNRNSIFLRYTSKSILGFL